MTETSELQLTDLEAASGRCLVGVEEGESSRLPNRCAVSEGKAEGVLFQLCDTTFHYGVMSAEIKCHRNHQLYSMVSGLTLSKK